MKEHKDGEKVQHEHPMTFEIAWEVCNKVGGIHTVIKTKVPQTIETLGVENYCCIGPYKDATAKTDLDEKEPQCPVMRATLAAMRERGVIVTYGRWLIDGAPYVVLFDVEAAMNNLDEWKQDLYCFPLGPCSQTPETIQRMVAPRFAVAPS